MKEQIIKELKEYIGKELLSGSEQELGEDENLLKTGILDSLGAVRLVAHFEKRLDATIPPEALTVENFRTIRDIGSLLSEL